MGSDLEVRAQVESVVEESYPDSEQVVPRIVGDLGHPVSTDLSSEVVRMSESEDVADEPLPSGVDGCDNFEVCEREPECVVRDDSSEMKSLKASLEQANETIALLESRKLDLESRLRAAESIFSNMGYPDMDLSSGAVSTVDVVPVSKQLSEAHEVNKRLTEEVESMRDVIASRDVLLDRVDVEVSGAKSALCVLLEQVKDLHLALDEAHVDRGLFMDRLAETESTVMRLISERDSFESELCKSQILVKRLEEEQRVLESAHVSHEKCLEAHAFEVGELEMKLAQSENVNRSLTEEYDSLKLNVAERCEMVDKLELELDRVKCLVVRCFDPVTVSSLYLHRLL